MNARATNDADFDARFARIEGLLAELSRAESEHLQRAARELLGTVLELHLRGLERILEIAGKDQQLREELARDPRVSALLLLHGLHPVTVGERVAHAVAVLSERFQGQVEHASIETRESTQLVVLVQPKAGACASTRANLKRDWEEALLAAAPDAEALSVELAEPATALITLRTGREQSAPVRRTPEAPR